MSVYVDKLREWTGPYRSTQARRVGARNGNLWCHLFGDPGGLEEVHVLADRIGMRREWLHRSSPLHYDLVPSRRARAVRMGAVEVTDTQAVDIWKRHRVHETALAVQRTSALRDLLSTPHTLAQLEAWAKSRDLSRRQLGVQLAWLSNKGMAAEADGLWQARTPPLASAGRLVADPDWPVLTQALRSFLSEPRDWPELHAWAEVMSVDGHGLRQQLAWLEENKLASEDRGRWLAAE